MAILRVWSLVAHGLRVSPRSPPTSPAPALYSKRPYGTVRDFAPISLLATRRLIVIVNAQTPIRSIKAPIANARAAPGKLNDGLPGGASAAHIAGELFKRITGAPINAAPYSGAAPAQVALLGNAVQLMFANLQTGIAMAKRRRISLIGVAAEKRLTTLPDVPTLGEQGIPKFEVEPWQGLLAPKRTLAEIIAIVHQATVKTRHITRCTRKTTADRLHAGGQHTSGL